MISPYDNRIRKILEDDFKHINGRDFGNIGKHLSEEQKGTLRAWKEYYEMKPSSKGGTTKPASVYNTLATLRLLALHLQKPLDQASQADLIDFFRRQQHKSDFTLASMKVTVRMFYKWLQGIRDRHRFPAVVDHELLRPQRGKPSKTRTPENFLAPEEMQRMLDGCTCMRDRLFLMLTYGEGSMRAGEVVSLNYGSVVFSEKYCRLWIPSSKSRERPVTLVDTFPYLRDYLNYEYALPRRPDAPLFYGMSGHNFRRRLQPSSVSEALQRVARRVGIQKPVFAHMGRHQSITMWGRHGMSSTLNAKRAGINTDTLERVYLHHDDADVEDAILSIKHARSAADKAAQEAERLRFAPKTCARCGRANMATATVCPCGAYVDVVRAEEAEQHRAAMDRLLIDELVKERIEEVTRRFVESGEALKQFQVVKNGHRPTVDRG